MSPSRSSLVSVLLAIACAPVPAQALPAIDTTGAFTGTCESGVSTVGQVITTPKARTKVFAFDFFVGPNNLSLEGGIFEWEPDAGQVIGAPLAVAPASPPDPSDTTLNGMRARFEFPSGVPLRRGMSYLIFANWLGNGDTAPCWLMTPDVYPGGAGKQIFPPNGIVAGPWSDVFYWPSPSVDWAIRVYFARDSRHRK